jgi:hypothetical protein
MTPTVMGYVDALTARPGETVTVRVSVLDPSRRYRAELVRLVWSPTGRLSDPPAEATGHDGLDVVFTTLQGQFPGHRFRRTSGVDAHHGVLRFAWELVGPDGAVALAGLDVAALDADGRLARVVGFFGDLPAREAA